MKKKKKPSKPRADIPRLRNGGQWTEARYRSFIFSALRGARWPVKYECLKQAFTGKRINPKTGRLCSFYLCAACRYDFPHKEVCVDHINPVVPTTGFSGWDNYIERMFVEIDGFQCLCKKCHKSKTDQENSQRKQSKEN